MSIIDLLTESLYVDKAKDIILHYMASYAEKYKTEISTFYIERNYHSFIGFLYLLGYGVEKNIDKAKEFFDKSISESNDKYGYYGVSVYYKYIKDKEKYEDYLSISVSLGVSHAYYETYLMYENDDFDKAMVYLKKAEELENSYAYNVLRDLYTFGKDYRIIPNYKKAFEYSLKSSMTNNWVGHLCLSLFYFNGNYVEKNVNKGRELLDKAYILGKNDKRPFLINLLNRVMGEVTYYGVGYPKNKNKAYEFFKISYSLTKDKYIETILGDEIVNIL